MKLSIIIPTYNKATRLNIVLMSIQQEIMRLNNSEDVEIIIVDDGSHDDTLNIVNQYKKRIQVNYVFQKNSGLSVARNTGIKCASNMNLLFLDDDRVVCDGYLQGLSFDKADIVFGKQKEWYIRNIEDHLDDIFNIVTTKRETLANKTFDSRYYTKTKAIYGKQDTSIPWVGCTFANTLIKKEVFDKIGDFSNQFVGWGFEDVDVSYRAFVAGYKFALSNDMTTYHLFHQHVKDIFKQRDRNYEVFLARNPDYAVSLYKDFYHNNISLLEYDEMVRTYYNSKEQ